MLPLLERKPAIGVMRMSALEMSKKMVSEHFTLTRPCKVPIDGAVMPALPSFAVPASRVVGKVCPPSTDRWMSTLAQLTGAAVVPATFQVTVCALPPAQVGVPVDCEVTRNGPETPSTLTMASSDATPPPPVRLSRAVRRKSISRA